MAICALCGTDVESVTHAAERWLIETIMEKHPEWVEENGGCPKCIEYYRNLDKVVKKRD